MEKIKPIKAVNKKSLKGKKDQPIEEAKVINEEKADTHEDFLQSAKESVSNEDSQSSHIKSTEDVNLDENKEEQDYARVNFMDDEFMSSMIGGKTEKSEEKSEGEEKSEEKKKESDNNKQGSGAPVDESNMFTRDDMNDFAEVSVDILDIGISTALKFYSKDTSVTAYELANDKKKRLVRQLVNIFMKHQLKFPLEFMFIVTLVLCYTGPFLKAKKTRKEIQNGTFKREGGKPGK